MRRQLILFLVAILLPSVVLIGVTIRLVTQERQLNQDQGAQARRVLAAQVRDRLLARLHAIRRDEIRPPLPTGGRYRQPETALVAWLEGDRLVLPWEDEPAPGRRGSGSNAAFQNMIRTCEQAEYGSGSMDQAAGCYQRAAALAGGDSAAYARLLWARALDRAGRQKEAAARFGALLDAPAGAADEDGVPVRLFAAQRVLQDDAASPQAQAVLAAVMAGRAWLPPMACFVASDVAERLGQSAAAWDSTEPLRRRVAALVRTVEQAQALQNDLPRTGLLRRQSGAPAPWVSYGDEPWLVAVDRGTGDRPAVIAVRANAVFRPVEAALPVRLSASGDPQGEAAGAEVPGVRVIPQPGSGALRSTELPRWVSYGSLGLVAAATMFVAWLVWRDLRREMHVADLRSQFVSSVSHELKTPLTSIRMLAETLQMGRAREPATESEYLDTIVHECERLSRLVDGVLLFSKLEQGKMVYRFRQLHPEETVRAAARAMEYPLEQRGFRLNLQLEPDLPLVRADHDALEQAVLNLLSNAVKYSGDARDIELALCRDNGGVVIRVTDHGCGIPAAEQSRIFEKFYRAATPGNQSIPGTGLGLALVSQIVKAHGGRIAVKSAPGEGSTFALHLPAEVKS